MKTEKQRSRIRKYAAIPVVPWLLFSTLLAGCKPEEPKKIPTDRLTVEYTVDRDTIHVGDPAELAVTVYYPTNGLLKLPELGREKDIVLLKRDWENVPREDGLVQSEARYSLTSFRLGDHVVSSNNIVCTLNDRTFTTNFPPVTLRVVSSLPEEASSEIADIKPVQKLPARMPRWLWVVLASAAIAFLVGLATAKLWKKRAVLLPSVPPVPPHIIAMNALQSLLNKGLLEQDECKPFYTELSLILRTYLEGRFQLNAPDETTEEIVEEMSRSPELNGAQRNILQEFMRQADMVKFAKGHTDRMTMEAAFNTTKQFIEETKPDETEPEADNVKTNP